MIRDAQLEQCLALYDFPDSAFESYQFFKRGKKNIFIASKDLSISQMAFHQGIPFLKINVKFPKLTSVAALQFGSCARKNLIHLDRSQLDSYMSREVFALRAPQVENCLPMTYTLMFYQSHCIGLGIYGEDLQCAGLMPKAWSHYVYAGKMDLDGYQVQ